MRCFRAVLLISLPMEHAQPLFAALWVFAVVVDARDCTRGMHGA